MRGRLLALALLALACSRPATPPADASAPRRASAESSAWDFALNVGDVNVPWSRPIWDATGSPVNLAGATIQFRYRLINQSSPAVTNAGTVTGSAPPFEATYVFAGADTATPGNYHASFIVTLPRPDGGTDGSQETFAYPTNRLLTFSIQAAP